MENNHKDEVKMLSQQLEESRKIIVGLRKEIEYMKDKSKPSVLYLQDGATPMTIAELVVRESSDKEILEEVVYFLNCYLNKP